MKKRVLSLILLAAMLLTFTACSEGGNDETENTDVYTSPPSENPDENDDLPADLNFEGRTLRILSSLGWEQATPNANDHNMLLHEDVSNTFSNAMFFRNTAVKDRFKIEMTENYLPYDKAMETVRSNYMSGDDLYDLVGLVDRDMITLIGEGAIHYIDEVEYVNLNKAYWNKALNESMTIKDRQLIAYGDMNVSAYDKTFVLLYNKTMVENYKLGNLYDIVDKGDWTWELFYEMASQVIVNSGDQLMDENDQYGWLAAPKQICPTVWISGGGLSITKNAEDIPEFSMDNEKMSTLLDMAYALTYNNNIWFLNEVNATDVQDPQIFKQNRALFTSTSFGALFKSYYNDLPFEYGIIPHPMGDNSQKEYYTRVEGGRPYGVPSIISDTSFSGAMLEAMNCEARKIIMPVYYETCLKTRYSSDLESGKVIDILVASRVYDLGDTFFSNQLRDGFVLQTFVGGSPISSSVIARNKSKVEGEIKKLVDSVTAK